MLGNACYHRIPALFAASFASCGLGLLAISGSLCQFVELRAKEGHYLYIPGSNHVPAESYTFLGVICKNPQYEEVLGEEVTYVLSRVFLFVAIAIGSFTCVLSWALSTFLSPTEMNWRMLSIFAAVTALLQMPVFLVFETSPCTSYPSEQECVLATGSFYLILSTTFWVVVTVATQFLDPPRWADEINAWRTKPSASSGSADGDGESQAPLLLTKKKTSFLSGIQRWANERDAASVDLPKNQTDSLSIGDDEEAQQQYQIVPYNGTNNYGIERDASKSVVSSKELDAIMIIVEEGRLKEATPLEPPSRNESFAQEEPENLQVALWDNMRSEETTEKQLVTNIYDDLENQEPPTEKQLVVQSTRASQWALPVPPAPRSQSQEVHPTPKENVASIKAPSVMKSFADNLMMRSRIRRPKHNNYCLMDDDDSEASSHLLPSEVIIPSREHVSSHEIPGSPTRQAEFPCYDQTVFGDHAVDGPNGQLHPDDEEYPDPILSYMGSFESSTDGSDPDPIFSPAASSEMDEYEHAADFGDSESNSSSKSSSSDEWGPRLSSRDRSNPKRVRSRAYSSVRSVVSSTSLLDTMIAEETDVDLQEFEDPAPYDLVRSKSAPTQLRVSAGMQRCRREQIHFDIDHASVSTLGSSLFHNPSAISDPSCQDAKNIQLAPITSQRSRSFDGREEIRDDSKVRSFGGNTNGSACDTEFEDPVDCISFSSSVHQFQLPDPLGADGTVPGPDDEVSKLDEPPPIPSLTSDSFECPDVLWDNQKCLSPASPALTAPETPSPNGAHQTSLQDLSNSYESEKSWKEERELRGGIHAQPLDGLERSFDEEAAEVSCRVREARIRRLQREKEVIKRGRACSQGATYRRRPHPSAMSSVVDKLDLQLIEVLRPDGLEYGPDERSL